MSTEDAETVSELLNFRKNVFVRVLFCITGLQLLLLQMILLYYFVTNFSDWFTDTIVFLYLTCLLLIFVSAYSKYGGQIYIIYGVFISCSIFLVPYRFQVILDFIFERIIWIFFLTFGILLSDEIRYRIIKKREQSEEVAIVS
jgi:hypothetical protein